MTTPLDTAPIGRRSLLKLAGITGGVIGFAPALVSCDSDSGGSTSKRLIIGVFKPFRNFDPYEQDTVDSPSYHTFYDYLIEYDDNYKPIPRIAESWTFSDDKKSITIKLREGVKFHSGKDMTAADVVAGVKRQQDTANAANQAIYGQRIASAVMDDDHTVTVTMNGAVTQNAFFDWMFDFAVVEASKNDPESLLKAPAGSGPFKLTEFSPDNFLKMEKNPDYWMSGLPLLDSVEFRLFGDAAADRSALQSGTIDLAAALDMANVDALKSSFEIQLSNPGALLQSIVFNTSKPPFDNVKVRQAIGRALDRDRIAKEAWFGNAKPVYSIFAPDDPAWDQGLMDSLGYDLDAARQLLQESGAAMKGTAMFPTSNPADPQMFQILQADLKKIGFDLQLQPMEVTAWSALNLAGDVSMTREYIDGTLTDPYYLTDARLLTTGNKFLLDEASLKDWAAAVAAVGAASTEEEQKQAFANINKVLIDISWVIGVVGFPNGYAYKKSVQGFEVNQRSFPILTNTTVKA